MKGARLECVLVLDMFLCFVLKKPAPVGVNCELGSSTPTRRRRVKSTYRPDMAEDRRQAKQAVLDRVNTALVLAGLNDTVWSIRDCDSTLFVLMYKKLVGKVSHTFWKEDGTCASRAC